MFEGILQDFCCTFIIQQPFGFNVVVVVVFVPIRVYNAIARDLNRSHSPGLKKL